MSSWYVRRGEVDVGPLTGEELLDLIREGSVRPETPVRKNDSAWFEAMSVGGLFEAAAKPTYEYYCPECGKQVDKPPSVCGYCEIRVSYARPKKIEHRIAGYTPERAEPTRSASKNNWLQRVQAPRDRK